MRSRRLLAAALALGPVLLASLVRAAPDPAAPASAPASAAGLSSASASSSPRRGWLSGLLGPASSASGGASSAASGLSSPAPSGSGPARLVAVVGAASSPPATSPPAVAGPPPASSSVQIFVRTGLSMPVGRFSASGRPLTEGIQGAVPLILDVGGKPLDRLFVGAYLGFNPGLVGEQYRKLCTGDVSCSANNVRLGIEVQVHLFPASHYNPWVGVGVGIEATTISVDSNEASADSSQLAAARSGAGSLQGPELLHLMGGFDNRLSDTFGFGPFVAFTLGRYETITSRNSVGVNRTLAITSPATHGWLMAGVRLVLFP